MGSFLLVFALIGATLIIVRSTLLKPVRQLWPTLLECSMCVGVWVGAAAGASGVAAVGHGRALDALIGGSATSILALLADAVLVKLIGDERNSAS
jgi:hypothetical protein